MIGFESYQDPRLIPAEYWAADEPPTEESITEDLVEKYRSQAIAELEEMVSAGEADNYDESHIQEFALYIAEDNGETVEKIMRQHENSYTAERSEWLAGRAW